MQRVQPRQCTTFNTPGIVGRGPTKRITTIFRAGEGRCFYNGKEGVAFDCVTVNARPHARAWRRAYSGNVMRSFAFAQHGELLSNLLAREWCMKSNYYFQQWLDGGEREGWDFAGVPEYDPGAGDFLKAFAELDPGSRAYGRFVEFMNWVPRPL